MNSESISAFIKTAEPIFQNKTRLYLYPFMRAMDRETVMGIHESPIFAVCIDDFYHKKKEHYDTEYLLYCLSWYDNERAISGVDRLIKSPGCKDHYLFPIKDAKDAIMLVMDIPPAHQYSYDMFMKGHFSKMYTPEQRNFYYEFSKDESKSKEAIKMLTIARLTKDPKYKKKLEHELNRNSVSTITIPDDVELDSPPYMPQEIFNYEYDKKQPLITNFKPSIL